MMATTAIKSKFSQELGPNDSFCHVVGLASEQGKKRNGSAAIMRLANPMPTSTATADSNDDENRRAAVCIDGFPGPISIKLANLRIINLAAAAPAAVANTGGRVVCKKFSVGVGRGTLLDSTFTCVLVEDTFGDTSSSNVIPHRSSLSGAASRCRGNLQAVQTGIDKGLLVQKNNANKKTSSSSSAPPRPVIILLMTDLNVSRALNRLAMGDTTVQLASSSRLNQQLKRIVKSGIFASSSNSSSKQSSILVKFHSHRISPDGFSSSDQERHGLRRYAAVLEGCFHIYPCALQKYLDALEVRFAAGSSSDPSNMICGQDIYLDTGVEEAVLYAQNALALGEADRLEPKILAQVDPQAFWSAVLWIDDFIKALEQAVTNNANDGNHGHEHDKLTTEWKRLRKGKDKSRMLLQGLVKTMDNSDQILLKGPLENWGLNGSEDFHLRVATDHALASFQLIQKSLVARGIQNGSLSYQIIEDYRGSEIDKVMDGLKKLQVLIRQHEASTGGEPIGMDEYHKLYNKSMKAAGFDRYSDYRVPGALEECGHCGKRSKTKLMPCARCGGTAYCDAECQKADWKKHRNGCSRVMVQLQKQMKEAEFFGGGKVQVALSEAASMPPSPCALSEVSGTGMMSILWNHPGMSIIFFPPFDPSLSAAQSEMTMMAASQQSQDYFLREGTIRFMTFAQLPPRLRFVITCGPLPDIDVAKSSLDEALASVDGDVGKLRFDKVQFTALEWAAKKGNMDIVKWLCTDERTKALVSIGCPVGWACYTNKIDIARYLVSCCGADPAKTDVVLFNHLSPLFLAAQNGHLDAMQYLVDECGQDIHMRDRAGRDVLENICDSTNWRECPGNVACHKWAKKKLRTGR